MKKVLLLLVFVSTSAWAGVSAKREKGEDFRLKMTSTLFKSVDARSATSGAGDFEDLETDFVTEWASEAQMQSRFEEIRDERFIEYSSGDDFLRRISWLYPDDGCFARAAMAINLAEEKSFEEPKRVFVFGNLNVKTDNSSVGEVSWWYHTAPIVRIKDQVYVLDPAIEPSNPLTIEDWILRQVPDLSEADVVYCEGGSYSPYSSCRNPAGYEDDGALSDQMNYLYYEWQRQESLGRDPLLVLGDQPPWM